MAARRGGKPTIEAEMLDLIEIALRVVERQRGSPNRRPSAPPTTTNPPMSGSNDSRMTSATTQRFKISRPNATTTCSPKSLK